ncbi:monofunctional biosynthetic peptidoglycan transglycosylase, partial [Rhodobacteraceae bacterium WD3A24]
MARRRASARTPTRTPRRRFRPLRWLRRWLVRGLMGLIVVMTGWVLLYTVVNPPGGLYIFNEYRRLGAVERDWVDIEAISPHMARAAVAAEDADFCLHWGFDMGAIRAALEAGARRGASTITQQTVKNVFLWQARSWPRKALEAVMTPMVEAAWSKQRILEIYLNIAEFDEGVFGVEAGARHYFGVAAADLTLVQAARLAAVLPAPRQRDAARPAPAVRRRAAAIMDGAATIAAD